MHKGIEYAKTLIRNVPDFPVPGILFKDITPMLADARALHIVLDAIAEDYIGAKIDVVVGVEARGFIFGGALAARLNAGFVPARKPGKLPTHADKVSYTTEYSTTELEIHRGSFKTDAQVLIVDDVLATGGTAKAAADLVRLQGAQVMGFAFVIELAFLNGRKLLGETRVDSVISY